MVAVVGGSVVVYCGYLFIVLHDEGEVSCHLRGANSGYLQVSVWDGVEASILLRVVYNEHLPV